MSIQFGDILQHNNPYYPITDVTDVKGGLRTIATFSNIDLYNAFNSIPEKLKQNYSTLLITTTNKYYYLSGTDSTVITSWTPINSGFSGSGTTNSVTKWLGQSILGDSIMSDNGDTITINGNLLITGTTSTVNSENLIVKDPIILLAGAQSGTPSFDSGFFVNRGTGATQAFIWDESSNEFSFFSTTSSSTTLGNVSIGTYSNVRTGALSVGTGVTSSSRFSVSSTGGTLSLVVNEKGDTIFSGDTKISGQTFSSLPPGSITFGSKTAIYSPADRQIVIGTDRSIDYSYNYGWKFTDYQITNLWGNVIQVQNTIGTIGNLWIGSNYAFAGYGVIPSQQSTLFVKATLPSIMRVVGTGATWSNSASIFEINNSGVVSIGTSQSMSGSKLFIQSGTSSSTIGSNVMLDLYNPDTVGLGSQVSELAFSADTAGTANAYNTQHRYAIISGYANTWNNIVTGGGIKFSTRNGTVGSLVTALVVAPNGSVYNASRGSNTLYGLDAISLTYSTGINNVAIGTSALQNNLGGVNNTAVGMSSMASNTSGNYNTAVGCQALVSNVLGSDNTAIGISSQHLATQSSGNTSVGRGSLYNNLSADLVAIGTYALTNNTIGLYNTAIGHNSLQANTTTVTSLIITDSGYGYTTSTTFSNVQLLNISGSIATTYPIVDVYVGSTGSVSTITLVTKGSGFKNTSTIMGANLGTGVTFSVSVGSIQSGDSNTAVGYQSLFANTTGVQNIAIGYQSLFSNIIGYNNTTIGHQSLYYNTTGFLNTAIGHQSLFSNTIGYQNTAIGSNSLKNNKTGFNNTGVGSDSLQNNISGNYNTSVGNSSLFFGTQSNNNTAIGFQSLCYNQSNQNTAIGNFSLFANTTGSQNTAIGGLSLKNNTTGVLNTAIGFASLSSNTYGSYNVSIGYNSLYSNTTGFNNTAIGQQSLNSNINGSYNNAFGWGTQFSATQSNNNTSFGDNSLYYNLSSNLVAFGSGTLLYNTIGNYNTALGYQSLKYNITNIYSLSIVDGGPGYTASSTFSNVQLSYISGSTAISYPAVTIYVGSGGTVSTITLVTNGSGFQDNTTIMGANLGTGTFSVKVDVLQSGYSNTAVGYQSLYSNTTGYQNTAIGNSSLYFNLTGNGNTALGYQSLLSNTTGANNTTIGQQSLIFNTTGYQNTAVGAFSSQNNTLGSFNTTLGYVSSGNNKIGNNNVTIGYGALYSATQSSFNTAIGNSTLWVSQGSFNTTLGYSALGSMVIGDYNIGIGVNSGAYMSGTTSVATQSNNSIFIGYDTRPQLDNQTNQIVIGHGATGSGSNSVTLGASTITKTQLRGIINLGNVPQYGSNGLAISAGLVPGDIYQTPGNALMVVV